MSHAEPLSTAEARRSPGPWRTAAADLSHNRSAVAAAVVLLVVVLAALCAPLYADHVAHTDPFQSHVSGTTVVDGKTVPVLTPSSTGLGLGVTPIGPTWDTAHYFLGADNQGRDVMARLLYGGRTSLFIGVTAALFTCVLGTAVGVVAGYAGGVVDAVISRILDVIWAFPVYLLAICLSVVLLTNGLRLGPLTVDAGSLWLPVAIIAAIYVPYIARPLRGQVLVLRNKEYIHAAVGSGAPTFRILRREVLPNVLPTAIVFVPLMTALAMLTESALSFLSVGVQPPDASWGTIIEDGLGLLYTRPAVTIAPGLLIALTTAALNVLGDGVRDALDPGARLRGGV
ncbi:ABC transporter permease [Streptomyces sp. NL15-2K]|uniref:ABC transporter permease n=1 Tax=Streptomyces sp. NL15-2K TaxID=376149 RepID=UPI000F55F506|nr:MULTISPECIES: ABC transporter permease [Actinomycetes]WKX15059.1 ABC transporter permease [Kutzneria buriramensis]GCB52144.1 dipeptide transport system permease protein dppC [Streptomyces sp. NL15-2K]